MTPLEGPAETVAERDARQTREAQEASSRTVATFLQGLAVDVAVAIAVVVLAGLDSISDRAGLIALGIAVAKSVVTAIATYVVRRFVRPVDPAAR